MILWHVECVSTVCQCVLVEYAGGHQHLKLAVGFRIKIPILLYWFRCYYRNVFELAYVFQLIIVSLFFSIPVRPRIPRRSQCAVFWFWWRWHGWFVSVLACNDVTHIHHTLICSWCSHKCSLSGGLFKIIPFQWFAKYFLTSGNGRIDRRQKLFVYHLNMCYSSFLSSSIFLIWAICLHTSLSAGSLPFFNTSMPS